MIDGSEPPDTDAAEPAADDLFTDDEARVLGCLVEKEMTTPDQYPMSLNGVTLASNQKSNRDPVVDYSEALVERTLRDLTDRGVARMVHRPGDRVVKYRHALDGHLGVDQRELALLAVLLLRGPQTPGELRQRTQRYVEFVSLPELETTLDALGSRGLVQKLERRPGQKESRHVERLSVRGAAFVEGVAPAVTPRQSPAADRSDDVHALRDELADLRQRFEALLEQLGVSEI